MACGPDAFEPPSQRAQCPINLACPGTQTRSDNSPNTFVAPSVQMGQDKKTVGLTVYSRVSRDKDYLR